MRKIKAAIFDLGGTLIDDRQMIYTAFANLLGTGNAPSREDFDRNFTSNWPQMIREKNISPARALEKMENFTLNEKYLKTIKPYGGTVDALKRIKQKMPLALNTSFRKKEVDAILSVVSLPKFDAVATGDDINTLKPNPRSIREICKTLGLQPKECVMVGDTSADVMCGKNAGSYTIAVAWGTNSERDLARLSPDLIAYSWDDILGFIGV